MFFMVHCVYNHQQAGHVDIKNDLTVEIMNIQTDPFAFTLSVRTL